MPQDTVKQQGEEKATDVAKGVLKDRILSSIKQGLFNSAASTSGLAIGTALGMKKGLKGKDLKSIGKSQKKELFRKALTNQGLTGMATGAVASNTIVPAVRLHKMHNEELGKNPDLKDYAKLEAANGLPSAAIWGMMLKNRKHVAHGLNQTADAIEKFKETKKLSAFKHSGKAAAGGGAIAVADKGADFINLLQTPESIVNEKKKKMNGGTGMDTKTAFEILEYAVEKTAAIQDDYEGQEKTALDIIEEAYEKHVELEQEKTASGFVDKLLGNNIKRVDNMIAGERAAKGVWDNVGKAGQFVKNVAEPYAQEVKDTIKGNKYTQIGADGTIKILDKARKHAGKADLDGAINAVKNEVETKGKDVKKAVDDFDKHVKDSYTKKDMGDNIVTDTLLRPIWNARHKKNEQVKAIAEKVKNGEELTRDELRATMKANGKLVKDIREGNLTPLQEKIREAKNKAKGSNEALKSLEDEQVIRENAGKIERLNKVNRAANIAQGTTSEGNRIVGEFDNTFSVNGQKPSEGLNELRNKEVAKTWGARGLVGAGAIGAGAALGKSSETSQQQGQHQQINPYQSDFRPRRENVNKVASAIIEMALMEK